MIEAVIAASILTVLFLALFFFSRILLGKMLTEYAAMKAARARAVGLNGFMCKKAARICVVPVAGERLTPAKDDARSRELSETALLRMYLQTPNSAYADGLLRYKDWEKFDLTIQPDGSTETRMEVSGVKVGGAAMVDGFPVYLHDQGL